MSIGLTRGEPFAAPVVESLSFRVVVDSSYDRFIGDASHPMVKIEHVRHISGRELSTFAGEWGLSLHLEPIQVGAGSPSRPGHIPRHSFERVLENTLVGDRLQDYVEHTVGELKQLSPDVVIPMHCSGSKFVAAMHRQMPDRLVTTNIGSRFTFGV